MSTDGSTTSVAPSGGESSLEKVRDLGSSPVGEAFVVKRVARTDSETADDSEPITGEERFVLKKITRAQLKAPDRFRQKFEALCRLEHPNLCPYRDLYIGEKAARITRDFVDGLPLNQFLLRPITDEERDEITRNSELSEASEVDDLDDASRQQSDEEDTGHLEETDEDAVLDTDPETIDSPADVAPADSSGADDAPSAETSTSDDAEGKISTDPAPRDADANTDGLREAEAPPGLSEESDDRPTTLEIPESLLEDSEVADQALDLIISRLRRVLPQIIDALEYLHRFRHVHGNLNPSNIMVTEEETVVLTDFGLHPELVIPPSSRRRYACYQAPETAEQDFSPRSDLYSLGAILFEALADRPYGERRTQANSEAPNGETSRLYLSEIVPHCPASWADLIHGLLAEDPEERLALDEVHAQLASSEQRSVSIPASVVQERDTLFGRRDSLNKLTEQAKECSQNRKLSLAIVEGETGVGKTAIVDALARWAAQLGWVVLHGRCYHRQPTVYQGWEDIIDRLAAITDDLPEKSRRRLQGPRQRAARLFPQLTIETENPPEVSRHAAVTGLRTFLERLSVQRPILICLDDLHWAGRDSLRLLADLAEQPEHMRVMVVATARPFDQEDDYEDIFWSELSTAPIDIDQVIIEGFSKQEAREYVLANAVHLSLRQKQNILRRGGFNPLLIDELIHELNDQSDLPFDDPQSDPSGTEAAPEADDKTTQGPGDEIDDHLSSFVEHRLTALTRAERLVMQLLAIASGPLPAGLIARAMSRELGTQTADLVSGREVCESLVRKRLARRARHNEHSADQSTRYVVIHDLCRQVIYEEVGRDHHARLCGLIADALDADEGDAHDLRFEYLDRAGRTEEAAKTARKSALKAADRFAYYRAIRMWQWLQQYQDLSEGDRNRFSVALLGAGQGQEALEQLNKLLPYSPSRKDEEIRVRRRRIEAALSSGNRDGGIQATDEAFRATMKAYRYHSPLRMWPLDLRERLLASVSRWSDATAIARHDKPDPETAQRAQLLRFALERGPLLRTAATPHLEHRFARLAHNERYGPLLALDRLQMVGSMWLPFLVRDGKNLDRWVEQATTIFKDRDDPQGKAHVAEASALLARHRGDFSQALTQVENASGLLEVSGGDDELLRARLALLQVDVALIQGDVSGATSMVGRFLHRARRHRWSSTLASLAACDLALVQGNLTQAHHHLDTIDTFIGDDQNCLLHLWAMDRRTRVNVGLGRAEVAVAQWDLLLDRVYSRALRKLPAARMIIHRNLCIALAALAHRQAALDEPRRRETVRRFQSRLRRLGDLEPWMGVWEQGTLHRLRARFELTRQRPNRALRHAQRAIDLFPSEEESPPLIRAMNLEVKGRILQQMEAPNARAILDQARALCDESNLFLPLVLEGWPVPASHAALKADPD